MNSSAIDNLARAGREFWSGATRPGAGVIYAALALAAFGWIAVMLGSTEEHVRRTAAEQWMRDPLDDYSRLAARAIQGAAVLARGPNPTFIFVGPSSMREIMPPEERAGELLSDARGGPCRALTLCANSLNYIHTAAIIDRFGGSFSGMFVVNVNRHMLARPLADAITRSNIRNQNLGFSSAVLSQELALAGLPAPMETGLAFRDHFSFYHRSLGGWRHSLGGTPVYWANQCSPGTPPTLGAVVDALSGDDERWNQDNLDLLSRIATRLRQAGTARLVLLETPWSDIAIRAAQTRDWQPKEDRYAARMIEWSRSTGVAWVNVTAEANLQVEDFCDSKHVAAPEARLRFARAAAKQLSALLP